MLKQQGVPERLEFSDLAVQILDFCMHAIAVGCAAVAVIQTWPSNAYYLPAAVCRQLQLASCFRLIAAAHCGTVVRRLSALSGRLVTRQPHTAAPALDLTFEIRIKVKHQSRDRLGRQFRKPFRSAGR